MEEFQSQTSVRSDGGAGSSGPPEPFPWIRHWLWVQDNENSSKGMSKIHQRSEGTLTDTKNIP